jgi:hypothetical protein
MKNSILLLLMALPALFSSCVESNSSGVSPAQSVHFDMPFTQDYSIKYYLPEAGVTLNQVFSDRNGVIQIHSSKGLLKPHGGEFLLPGTLVADHTYLPMADKKVSSLGAYQNQLVYLDGKAILSNAWAGKLYSKHQVKEARLFAGGKDFAFLISDGPSLHYVVDSKAVWSGQLPNQEVTEIRYDTSRDLFWILGPKTLATYSPGNSSLNPAITGEGFTCFALTEEGRKIVIGTRDGFLEVDADTKTQAGNPNWKLPCPQITHLEEINGNLWFGSEKGAFMRRPDGKFNYYFGERWLPGEKVVHLSAGSDNSVLVLTDQGLGKICFKTMTLQEKAMLYEQQVRQRHIRYGFNATLDGMEKGNIGTGRLSDSDNDGLWTAMYLGSQVFRYAATKSDEALQNCRESLDAMERLYTINPVPGFPSRSFARRGYINQLADPDRWQHAPDPEWDWKATTSSDEAIGHIFVFGAMAELIDDQDLKHRSIRLIDTLMQHIVDNDLYLVDYDGKPTTWGRWNPEYVNALPKEVGDRKINASNLIAMLQTAYHFTKKDIYKDKAFKLMHEHGYFENLMRPMKEIGEAPEDASEYSKMLSSSWNHSDDEMYFLGYWGLYRYAFNDTLKTHFKETILDHWEIERPEKEAAWNIFTALTGVQQFDLPEAVWYLQEYPLDLITWKMTNSHRKDIEPVEQNFRRQTTQEVLPPDELRISRHNANRFTLDGGNHGTSEYSAGDIWLLPYWMGRYLQVISPPYSQAL